MDLSGRKPNQETAKTQETKPVDPNVQLGAHAGLDTSQMEAQMEAEALSGVDEDELEPDREVETKVFTNDCGERNGVPYEAYHLTKGEGFCMVSCRGLNIGVVFEPNPLEGSNYLAFMGSGCYAGEHKSMDSAIAAVQVAYFG